MKSEGAGPRDPRCLPAHRLPTLRVPSPQPRGDWGARVLSADQGWRVAYGILMSKQEGQVSGT